MHQVPEKLHQFRSRILQVHSLIGPVVHLNQAGLNHMGRHTGYNLGRLNGPHQGAAVHPVKVYSRCQKPVSDLHSLHSSRIIQGDVTPALQEICLILLGLSVTDDVKHGILLRCNQFLLNLMM